MEVIILFNPMYTYTESPTRGNNTSTVDVLRPPELNLVKLRNNFSAVSHL